MSKPSYPPCCCCCCCACVGVWVCGCVRMYSVGACRKGVGENVEWVGVYVVRGGLGLCTYSRYGCANVDSVRRGGGDSGGRCVSV